MSKKKINDEKNEQKNRLVKKKVIIELFTEFSNCHNFQSLQTFLDMKNNQTLPFTFYIQMTRCLLNGNIY